MTIHLQRMAQIVSRFSSPREQRFRHSNYFEGVLGTSLEIQVVSTQRDQGSAAEAAILQEIDRLELIFNAYNPQSELCRWQSTFETEVNVSPELAKVLSEAESWRQRTCGAFNPAVEAFTRLWKAVEKNGGELSPHQLAVIGVHCKQPLWKVDSERSTAKRLTKLPITLNSIAKGFIIDSAARVGSEIEGVQEVLVNIGGDIRHVGHKNALVAIADPINHAENAVPTAHLKLSNQGVATSGNYRRGFQIGKKWHSHLLDPRTGWPVEEAIGVSVVAPDATTADVLATAFSVLTPDESIRIAEDWPEVGVLLVNQHREKFTNTHWDFMARQN